MARAFGLPIIWGTDPNLEGRSLSVARDAHIPAIYAEYHGGGGCDPAGVAAYVSGCLAVLADLGMIDRPPSPAPPAPLIVEDASAGCGAHAGRTTRSRARGSSSRPCSSASRVRAGELLGTVTDLLGRRVEPIHAAHSGIVLVLNTFPRMESGEAPR